jgi:hypothetical protein
MEYPFVSIVVNVMNLSMNGTSRRAISPFAIYVKRTILGSDHVKCVLSRFRRQLQVLLRRTPWSSVLLIELLTYIYELTPNSLRAVSRSVEKKGEYGSGPFLITLLPSGISTEDSPPRCFLRRVHLVFRLLRLLLFTLRLLLIYIERRFSSLGIINYKL